MCHDSALVERPNCSSTRNHSTCVQPWPPCSTACRPPASPRASASRRISGDLARRAAARAPARPRPRAGSGPRRRSARGLRSACSGVRWTRRRRSRGHGSMGLGSARARTSAASGILDAAVRLIAREGIDDVRIARIAQEAGVSAGAAALPLRLARRPARPRRSSTPTSCAGDAAHRRPDDEPRAGRRSACAAMIDQCLPRRRRAARRLACCGSSCGCARAPTPSCARPPRGCTRACTRGSREAIAEGVARRRVARLPTPTRTADRLLALIDGYGIRALTDDPAMPIERARAEIWAAVAGDLGLA